jgi:hypothetical protein
MSFGLVQQKEELEEQLRALQEHAVTMGRDFLENRCIADLLKTTILFKNGRVRTS